MTVDVSCGPKGLNGEPDVLYHNNGRGGFADVTRAAGITDPGYYGFGVLFTDLDDDGWPDIFVANDSTPNFLFHNNHDGTFSETGLVAGVALSGDGREQAGMGVDAGDYNGDGHLDLVVTHFSHDYTTLYENSGQGLFTDASYASGVRRSARAVSGLGRRVRGLRQRRPARSVRRQRPHLPRGGHARPGHQVPPAQTGVPEPREQAVSGRHRSGRRRRCCSRNRAAAPRSATTTTTATSTCWWSTWTTGRRCSATTRRPAITG